MLFIYNHLLNEWVFSGNVSLDTTLGGLYASTDSNGTRNRWVSWNLIEHYPEDYKVVCPD